MTIFYLFIIHLAISLKFNKIHISSGLFHIVNTHWATSAGSASYSNKSFIIEENQKLIRFILVEQWIIMIIIFNSKLVSTKMIETLKAD